MAKQEQNWPEELKRNVNIAFWLAQIVQRCFVVLTRNKFGAQALGLPCLFAFILMWVWYALTQDLLLLAWIGLWLCCYAKRRFEAGRIEGHVVSDYDGFPFDAIRYCGSELTAKRVVEPIMLAIVGFIAFKVYESQGWNYKGLPYFFMAGAVSVSFVASVQQRIWQRKLQAMRDGQMENDMLVRHYRDKYGN